MAFYGLHGHSNCRRRTPGKGATLLLGSALLVFAGHTLFSLPRVAGHSKAVDVEGEKIAVARRLALAAATMVGASPASATTAKDKEWLAQKASEPGVITLPSGLMYKILKEGPSGGKSPSKTTKCSCTYAGQLTSGKQFDAGTLDFAPNQVIKGWTEAMQLMKEGDKWELYIPSDLAYGDRGAGGVIPGGAALVFQMTLNQVKG
mmetsp:Transcript_81246/g.161190  ORF Transcript_81246/g.161190 Transcript_81246/m.161190 type:complete len:204 (-) Transcript_81246:171-782(-)